VRVLVSSTPEYSHLAPLIPLALELQRRGHEVLFAGCSKLGEWVQPLGIASVPAGLDLDPDRFGPSIRTVLSEHGATPPRDLAPETVEGWALRAVQLGVLASALAPDLQAVAEKFRPDLMIRDRAEFAAWVVGEAVGVPVVTVTFGLPPRLAAEREEAGDAFQALRRTHGLEPDPDLATLYAGLVLVPAPASYAHASIPVPRTVSFVQPMIHDTAPDATLPSWVAGLGARPAVYVTMGNIVNRQSLFGPFLEALADEPVDVIVTVGRSVDPTSFGTTPSNVHIEQYIPQTQLLPMVDVVVCHGGFNTVIGALAAGRPLVVAPMTADQPRHAARCAALGVGLVIDGNALDPHEIRTAIRHILSEPSYRDAAHQLQHEIDELPDIRSTADLAEHTAARL
jgi:MGT family glycosyltransferase